MNKIPFSLNISEAMKRSAERAKYVMDSQKPEYAVGFAEGVIVVDNKYFSFAWCAVMTQEKVPHFGGGVMIPLPQYLKKKIDDGSILEEDIEEFLQELFSNPFENIVEYALCSIKNIK